MKLRNTPSEEALPHSTYQSKTTKSSLFRPPKPPIAAVSAASIDITCFHNYQSKLFIINPRRVHLFAERVQPPQLYQRFHLFRHHLPRLHIVCILLQSLLYHRLPFIVLPQQTLVQLRSCSNQLRGQLIILFVSLHQLLPQIR